MTERVRNFLLGFVAGVFACLLFITYYGHWGGQILIDMGQRMKEAANTSTQ